MEYRIKKVGEPNKYELLVRHSTKKKWEKVTTLDRRINGFFLYLVLTGQLILNNESWGKVEPPDEEIEKALEILSRKF